MKKLLLIFFIIPAFIYGQDVPLTEKKVTTESMENKERKLKEKADNKVRKENTKRTNKHNRSLAMHPKNQIGYILNPTACPVGLNYYNFFNKSFGWYVDYRTGFNLSDNYWAASDRSFIEGLDMQSTGYKVPSGGYSVLNAGLATRISKSKYTVWIMYLGVGSSTEKLYEEYSTNYTYVSNSTDYVRNGGNTYTNFNFGILRQTSSVVSWQLGFDSAVPGINFGMGFTWD